MYTKKARQYLKKLALGKVPRGLERINLNAAGIDISPKVHAVAVPQDRVSDGHHVQTFGPETSELYRMVKWLKEYGIDTVAMESTGVYWRPVFEILQQEGFDVILVHANAYRNVPGKKTDVADAEWLQTLHTFGLLRGCFLPTEEGFVIRTYSRERQNLTNARSRQIQKMQKALDQMNVLVHRAVSDISGVTGMAIIRAIVKGERNPAELAKHRQPGCKRSEAEIAEALSGNFVEHHLFSLELALSNYDHCQEMIKRCDQEIERVISEMIPAEYLEEAADDVEARLMKFRPKKDDPQFNLPLMAKKILGVDCTAVDGVSIRTVLVLIAEIGYDFSRWKTAAHFASWMCLCPGNHKSGGESHSGRTRRSSNRLAQAFKNAANTLDRSDSPLGQYQRRMKARLGKAKGITATAHKLAKIIYTMVTTGKEYDPTLTKNQNPKQKKRRLANLEKMAKEAGYTLVPADAA
jgi:transposase